MLSADPMSRMLDEFRGRGWMALQPKHLDYVNTQFILIGHKDNALEKATDQPNQEDGEGKEKPLEELEKLEHEDEIRVEHLKGTLSNPTAMNVLAKPLKGMILSLSTWVGCLFLSFMNKC